VVDLKEVKEKIISLVHSEGPLLPVQISRKLEKDTIFAGAVLSELVKDKAILISKAKVGGSPVYYSKGQEGKLSLLYPHLPSKEKEAYESLRKNQILKDKECDPPIRIALRSIKDFSIPLEINGELYWRWYLTPEIEAKSLLESTIEDKEPTPTVKPLPKEEIVLKDVGDEFLNKVTNALKSKQIEISDIQIIKKKREIEGKIKINSDLGILDFLVVGKNKKRINEADISLANDRGRKNKLPILFLTTGEMTKKCDKYVEENLKGRLIIRKI